MPPQRRRAPEGSYEPGEMKFNANVSAEYDLVVTR